MEKKKMFNANYVEVMDSVIKNEGTGFTREISRMIPNRTPNSVIATLASMNKAGYLVKEKGVFEDKMLTKYTVTDAGRDAFNEAVAVKVVPEVEAPEAE